MINLQPKTELDSAFMRHLPPLRGLQAFEAVARLRSVTAAAEELAITPSAVSHRLRKLEDHLGISLFHRAKRQIALSDAGSEYLRSIGSAFDRIEQSSEWMLSGMASDVLTVHCPPSFGPSWLVPRIGEFLEAHPDIDLRIHASPVPVDFFRSDTDVEIRYGNSDWVGLHVTQLMEDRLAPLCSPEMRASLAETITPADLTTLPLIISERAPLGWDDWLRRHNLRRHTARSLRFDRGYLAVQAARLGLGVALESTVFAAPDIKAGRLVRLFEPDVGDIVMGAHTLVCPPIFSELRKVRVFTEWIVAKCRETEAEPTMAPDSPAS